MIQRIVVRNGMDLFEVAPGSDTVVDQSLLKPVNSDTSKSVVVMEASRNANLKQLVSLIADNAAIGNSTVVIAEDHSHHPVLAAIVPEACSVLSADASEEMVESEIMRAFARVMKQDQPNASHFSADDVLSCCKQLNAGELCVLSLVLQGHMNKTIASRLDVSERTIENRRRRIFDIFDTHSVAVLTRMISETIGCEAVFAMERASKDEKI